MYIEQTDDIHFVTMQGVEAHYKDKGIYEVKDAILATFECENVEILNWNCYGLTV